MAKSLSESLQLRENFIQNLNGTTMGEVILYSSQFPLLAFVAICLELLILNKFNLSTFKIAPKSALQSLFVFFLEIFMIIVPVILMFTILSDYIILFFFVVSGVILVIVILKISYVDDCILYWKLTSLEQIHEFENFDSRKQIFITYFRSFVLLVTAISILGVDFKIFPRRFAKTENYGVSLMDLGVGLFIVSNALVDKRRHSVTGLKNALLSSLALLLLGSLRCVLVQNLDYQMHVTEYGKHWNFFFTLAFVKILSSLILIVFKGHSFLSGLLLVVVHQYLLSHSLESLVLRNGGREDWFSANREGIISLSGFLSIHLFGITISNLVNPIGINKKLLMKQKFRAMLTFCIISVFLLCILYYFEDTQVSRRLANLTYVIWITAISLILLAMFLLVEFMSYWLLPIDSKVKCDVYYFLTPIVLESINFNGLIFFLVSNIITGLINIYVDPLSMCSLVSILILIVYMILDCAVVFFLHVFNVRLKL